MNNESQCFTGIYFEFENVKFHAKHSRNLRSQNVSTSQQFQFDGVKKALFFRWPSLAIPPVSVPLLLMTVT